MSKAGGVVLILGGLAVAAHVMPSYDGPSGSEADRRVDVAKTARVDEQPSRVMVVPKPQPAFRPIAPAVARAAEPAFSAPVVVTIAPRPSDSQAAPPPRNAAIPRDRDALARELQKELRRVGCYEGELNGAWTPSTRRAMKAFTDRVNATLPVDEPDAVLFIMVQSQQDRVCGKPCPTGQGISEDGRCLPNAILAKAARKAWPSATVAHAPAANAPSAVKPAPAISGWSTTITAGVPAVAATPRTIAAMPPGAPPPAEGRMALAGPPSDAATPGTARPPGAPPQAAAPPPAYRPPAPARRVERDVSWTRTMFARRFDPPN